MTILDEIAAYKREFVAAARREVSLEAMRALAGTTGPTRGFAAALRGSRGAEGQREPQSTLRVTAEIKRASPSRGVIRENFDPPSLAESYERGGAGALSVLTDEKYFQGSLESLRQARRRVSLPVLRKDFMLDPYQLYEARAAGADAILLIAGMIDWSLLGDLRGLGRSLGLDVLLEIHNAEELGPALEARPDILGINNRDLRTRDFKTDISTTERLIGEIPSEITVMSESGIRGRDDVDRLANLGVDAILVGERLMREPDPGAAIAAKLGIGPSGARL